MTEVQASLGSVVDGMDAVLAQLIGAKEQDIVGIVSPLPAGERAALAVFCYRRAHLQELGLAVAATCDASSLLQAAPSNAAGQALYAHSRAEPKPSAPSGGPRSRITLATSASGISALAAITASIATEQEAEAPTIESPELQPVYTTI